MLPQSVSSLNSLSITQSLSQSVSHLVYHMVYQSSPNRVQDCLASQIFRDMDRTRTIDLLTVTHFFCLHSLFVFLLLSVSLSVYLSIHLPVSAYSWSFPSLPSLIFFLFFLLPPPYSLLSTLLISLFIYLYIQLYHPYMPLWLLFSLLWGTQDLHPTQLLLLILWEGKELWSVESVRKS